jgi:hypothetical protein
LVWPPRRQPERRPGPTLKSAPTSPWKDLSANCERERIRSACVQFVASLAVKLVGLLLDPNDRACRACSMSPR